MFSTSKSTICVTTLVFMTIFATTLSFADPGSRRDRPSTVSPTGRTLSPQAKKVGASMRQTSRMIYRMLLAGKFQRVESELRHLKRAAKFKESRLEFLRLLPAPKDLTKIKEKVQTLPKARRDLILEWLTGRGAVAGSNKKATVNPKDFESLFPEPKRDPRARLY